MYSLFVLDNHNFRSSLCESLLYHNANLGTFLTIDFYFFFPCWPVNSNMRIGTHEAQAIMQ